ncbi:DUF803-domain-containing protein [Thozetella sp. PMI_491]|nr:DUF803-domain-containing protein [Thozetella sp. PMI_491]
MHLSVSPTGSVAFQSTSFASAHPSATSIPFVDHPADHPADEVQNWSSFIGIVTAIVGNVLIALALNVQRYAHIRLHRQRRERKRKIAANGKSIAGATNNGSGTAGREGYGAIGTTSNGSNGSNGTNGTNGGSRRNNVLPDDDGGEDAHETDPLTQSFHSAGSDDSDDSDSKVTSTYLKDPYWWLGQVLITVGEMGNFLAYGFAPASIVSPLGVVALISNCVIAPIVFKEVFRQRDFWGVLVAVAGAVTVVLSAKQEETKLEPHDVWAAITTMEFEIYMGITCSLIVLLMWLSPRYGNRTILIDLGLVGLFGGYTALATKGVSSMLSSTLFRAFTTPVTYALIAILLGTAVMQVRYVNKALQRFDSTQVIPIQFVTFTLCVIIGSAVLYRDFERTTAEQALKFFGGCLLTFFGVFLITSGRPRADEDEDTLEDVEGVEETIGLAEQGPQAPPTPGAQSRRGSESARPRRSSRVSFKDVVTKPLTVLRDSGVPSLRMPLASNPGTPLAVEGSENSPLLDNPWREDAPAAAPRHPGVGTHALSAESILTVPSVAVSDGTSYPGTPQPSAQMAHPFGGPAAAPGSERPVTPRASTSTSRPVSHHFGGPMYSPSPFSSTVSAVVADKLLAHIDSPTLRRISSRRSRPSLRNSLFVPQDELSDEERTEIANALEQVAVPLAAEGVDGVQGKKSARGRARSLSHTLGELLGVRRKSKSKSGDNTTDEDEDVVGGSENGRRGSAQG